MFNKIRKIIANRKANKRAMLESLVIEMSQEYLLAFEGEMKQDLREFCVTKMLSESSTSPKKFGRESIV